MGQQIIKQPNGKYSVYSSVTESVVLYDFTSDQLIEYFQGRAAAEAKAEIKRKLKDIESNNRPYHQFTKTWDEIKDSIPKDWLKEEMTCNKQKRLDWQNDYDYIDWEEFNEKYFQCDKCKGYDTEQCICYAR